MSNSVSTRLVAHCKVVKQSAALFSQLCLGFSDLCLTCSPLRCGSLLFTQITGKLCNWTQIVDNWLPYEQQLPPAFDTKAPQHLKCWYWLFAGDLYCYHTEYSLIYGLCECCMLLIRQNLIARRAHVRHAKASLTVRSLRPLNQLQ